MPSALAEWLANELARAGPGETAVLAGHFALYSAGAAAADLLDADHPPAGAGDMLAFTRLTWHAACTALAACASDGARLLVLVDDIQWIRPVLADRGAAERLAAAIATEYLQAHPALPAYHARVLHDNGLGTSRLLPQSDVRVMFSERELRIAAVQRLREQLRTSAGAALGLSASDDESRIDVTLPDHDPYCLVHSGRTNCAGGYLELLARLPQHGVRRLIALVPYRCLGQVTVGATLAHRLFGPRALDVVTVAVPDVGTSVAASVVRTISPGVRAPAE